MVCFPKRSRERLSAEAHPTWFEAMTAAGHSDIDKADSVLQVPYSLTCKD